MTIAFAKPESLSANAGLHDGDRVISINGTTVVDAPQAAALLGTLRGDIAIQVARVRSRPKNIGAEFHFMGGSEGQGWSEGQGGLSEEESVRHDEENTLRRAQEESLRLHLEATNQYL